MDPNGVGSDEADVELQAGIQQGRPAWPLLVLLNLILLLSLWGVFWFNAGEPVEVTEATPLAQWEEIAEAEESVDMALSKAQSPRALLAKDHRDLASYMANAALESGLSWVGLEISPGQVIGEVQEVMVRVGIEGPPFRLPVFLARLEDFPALGVVTQIEAQAVGQGTGLFQVQMAYSSPVEADTEWLSEGATGYGDAMPTLEKATGLRAWRAYSADEPRREAQAISRGKALTRSIPVGLWGLSRRGEGFIWTSEEGLQALDILRGPKSQ